MNRARRRQVQRVVDQLRDLHARKAQLVDFVLTHKEGIEA